MTDQPRGHRFPRWGPRGPFRVYSWLQAGITAMTVVFAALMLIVGFGLPAAVLVLVAGALALQDATGMSVWNRVGLGLRYLAAGWTGARSWTADGDDARPRWLAGVELSGFHLPHGVMSVVADRGRHLAAMRVSPTRDPWLQSRADREVAADDWARVVTSLPVEYVDRRPLQLRNPPLGTPRPHQRAPHPPRRPRRPHPRQHPARPGAPPPLLPAAEVA